MIAWKASAIVDAGLDVGRDCLVNPMQLVLGNERASLCLGEYTQANADVIGEPARCNDQARGRAIQKLELQLRKLLQMLAGADRAVVEVDLHALDHPACSGNV